MMAFHKLTGERVRGPVEMTSMLSDSVKNVNDIARHSRPKFHAIILEQLQKCGIEVEYGKEVVDYYEDVSNYCAGVILKDGSKYTADLVVAADGLRSPSSSLVHGAAVRARSSGNATYRVAFPVELALADPMVAERFQLRDDNRSVMEMWAG